MEKEIVQSTEWLESQKIEISIDLSVAAKQHLHFLGVVDQNRWLYEGPLLERAIYRYNAYWLPLLHEYSKTSSIYEGPLVPPLDCEWIWHCHRLNPVRYTSDCKLLYGKVLDNYNILSSTNECGNFKSETKNLWKRLYPMEPYNIDLDKAILEPKDISNLDNCVTYDLVSAVKRQSSFYSEVSKVHVHNEIIMQEAVGRYKAFLYLIKRNREMFTNVISVPTYDIDLMWHTHQLNPCFYYNDLEKLFGNILQHDDDVDIVESKCSKKLDNIFSETTIQWEKIFGREYWKTNEEMTTIMSAASEKYAEVARCLMVLDENKSDSCDVHAEKKSDSCDGYVGKNNDSCVRHAEKNNGGCASYCTQCFMTVGGENVGCVAAKTEKMNDECVVATTRKKNAFCATCVGGCFAYLVVTSKNESCVNDNSPISEFRNNVVAA